MRAYPTSRARWPTAVADIWRVPIASDVVWRTASIVVPIAAVLLGVKAYKIIFALWPVTQNTLGWSRPGFLEGVVQLGAAPLALTMACVSAAVIAAWWEDVPWRKRAQRAALAFLGMCALLVALKSLFDGGRHEAWFRADGPSFLERLWTNTDFVLAVVRSNVQFLLAYGSIVLLLLALARDRWQTWLYRVLLAVNVLLVALATVELTHYEKTGLNISGPLLLYATANLGDIAALVQSELDDRAFVALLTPVMLWSAGFAAVRLGRVWARKVPAGNWPVGYWIAPVLLYVLLYPSAVEQPYIRLSGDTFSSILHDFTVRPVQRWMRQRDAPATPPDSARISNFRFVASPDTRKLNVVLVILESVRASATGLYEPAMKTTPFLDGLAARSLVVEEMYAVVPRTAAAWIAILQGIEPSTNAAVAVWAREQAKMPRAPSLPRLLGREGYASAFFVPTHLNYESEAQLIRSMGFDRVVSLENLGKVPWVNYFGAEDKLLLPPILSWVDEQVAREQPFFLTVMTSVGHHKYEHPPSWPVRKLSASDDADYNSYLNCVAYIDDYLRELMAGFESRGLLQSTVLLVVGDHGDGFGEHGGRQHAMLMYEEAVHVPMLIHAPALFSKGRRIDGVRQQIDIVPTVAALLGYDIQGGRPRGLSMLAPVPRDRVIYFSSSLEEVALARRSANLKHLYQFGRSPTELYDLANDPGERHNLAIHERREVTAAEDDMLRWYENVRVAMLGAAGESAD